MSQNNYDVSAAALHAARTLMRNFNLTEKANIAATERNIAIIVDVCTQVFRVEAAVENLVRHIPWYDRHELAQSMDQLREAIRVLEVARNRMPRYGNGAPSRRKVLNPKDFFSKKEIEAASQLASQVASARTVSEQRSILRAAGIVR